MGRAWGHRRGPHPLPNTVEWCDQVLGTASKRRALARAEGDVLVAEIMSTVIDQVLDKRKGLAA